MFRPNVKEIGANIRTTIKFHQRMNMLVSILMMLVCNDHTLNSTLSTKESGHSFLIVRSLTICQKERRILESCCRGYSTSDSKISWRYRNSCHTLSVVVDHIHDIICGSAFFISHRKLERPYSRLSEGRWIPDSFFEARYGLELIVFHLQQAEDTAPSSTRRRR